MSHSGVDGQDLEGGLRAIARRMEEHHRPHASRPLPQPGIKKTHADDTQSETRRGVPERQFGTHAREKGEHQRVVPDGPDQAHYDARPGEANRLGQARGEQASPAQFFAQRRGCARNRSEWSNHKKHEWKDDFGIKTSKADASQKSRKTIGIESAQTKNPNREIDGRGEQEGEEDHSEKIARRVAPAQPEVGERATENEFGGDRRKARAPHERGRVRLTPSW